MRIKLDCELCTGHGRCYSLSPEVFRPDDEGNGVPLFERVPPELEAQARRAVLNCPEDAITLIDGE